MNLKQKNDSDCNFYHVISILIFHGTYLPLPPTTNIFLYWGELISFLGEGARPFSFIQPSVTNQEQLITELSVSCVYPNFSHF